MTCEDPSFVERQYRDASKLGARIALHRRFSTNEQPWQRWVFDQFGLPPDSRVLELGCGPGDLWAENLDRVPEGWSLTLTDASPGMVREAESRLGSDRRFAFRVADAQEIPFEDQVFDAVVANGMLHHVSNRNRAFSEISRVLKPGGILYAATNGEGHLREMGWMKRILDPTHPTDMATKQPLGFDLENGTDQLSPWFRGISLQRYEDALVVTETHPLVDYLLSGAAADAAERGSEADEFGLRVAELTDRLERELALRGEIRITKDAGIFVARK
ncbi:MAG: class I SAM-dependent methyltransferase [Actinomycetota bacterium]|nr:class I SAM-dependent methyltransferase [Actinomycetota bacterium]